MSKILSILIVSFFLASVSAFAQYPFEVLPGSSKTIDAKNDTLWVLSNSQFEKVLVAGKELKLVKEELSLMKKKESLINEKATTSDSILQLITKNRDDYEKRWRNCEKDLGVVGEGYDKMKRKTKIFKSVAIGGIPLAFLLGAFLL